MTSYHMKLEDTDASLMHTLILCGINYGVNPTQVGDVERGV